MNVRFPGTILMLLLLLSACTRMPTERQQEYRLPIEVEKTALIAKTAFNTPVTFTSGSSGAASEITVTSEYTSANGRLCRRFLERDLTSDATVKGLSCKDSKAGWQQIPLTMFAN